MKPKIDILPFFLPQKIVQSRTEKLFLPSESMSTILQIQPSNPFSYGTKKKGKKRGHLFGSALAAGALLLPSLYLVELMHRGIPFDGVDPVKSGVRARECAVQTRPRRGTY